MAPFCGENRLSASAHTRADVPIQDPTSSTEIGRPTVLSEWTTGGIIR